MEMSYYYIVGIKDEYRDRLSLTTINKEFCGKLIHRTFKSLWFKLNGSNAYVVIPEQWIEYLAPSKVLWRNITND